MYLRRQNLHGFHQILVSFFLCKMQEHFCQHKDLSSKIIYGMFILLEYWYLGNATSVQQKVMTVIVTHYYRQNFLMARKTMKISLQIFKKNC